MTDFGPESVEFQDSDKVRFMYMFGLLNLTFTVLLRWVLVVIQIASNRWCKIVLREN